MPLQVRQRAEGPAVGRLLSADTEVPGPGPGGGNGSAVQSHRCRGSVVIPSGCSLFPSFLENND